jgi:hypothetical protein
VPEATPAIQAIALPEVEVVIISYAITAVAIVSVYIVWWTRHDTRHFGRGRLP